MKCPSCGQKTLIYDSRPTVDGNVPWRRHKCAAGHRFTTSEVQVEELKRLRAIEKKYMLIMGLVKEMP